MTFRAVFVLVVLSAEVVARNVTCRKPSTSAESLIQSRKVNEKFLKYSCSPSSKVDHHLCPQGTGIGNIFEIYPALYTFALLDGRSIVIGDSSEIGMFCQVLNCGFPFASEVESSFPVLKNKSHLRHGHAFFSKYFQDATMEDESVLLPSGLSTVASNWYQYTGQNATRSCIESITGCAFGSVGCVERYAYRQLFPGGLRQNVEPSEVHGLSEGEYKAFLTQPYDSVRRFDATIHIRAQMAHLETKNERATVDIADAVQYYATVIFPAFSDKLTDYFYKSPDTKDSWRALSNASLSDPPRVFISCDDVVLKTALVSLLHRRPVEYPIIPVYVNGSRIVHMKYHNTLKGTVTVDQSVVDTAFDWYAMSLGNVLFAYRKGATKMFSTFAQTAMRVSLENRKTGKIFMLTSHNKWRAVWDWPE
mmetsp:Transcript_8819/g.13201  ORF Transcript_8819/g.13201 Transcript_8819/m.13201 type:complete len:420 (+) Transcript_8819:140-1399(+)